jgi:hypothetical protein
MSTNLPDGGLFAQALDILDQRGWSQGMMEDAEGRVCILGACNLAAFGNAFGAPCDDTPEADAAYEAEQVIWGQVAREVVGSRLGAVGPWNDDPTTTVDDVKQALRRLSYLYDEPES